MNEHTTNPGCHGMCLWWTEVNIEHHNCDTDTVTQLILLFIDMIKTDINNFKLSEFYNFCLLLQLTVKYFRSHFIDFKVYRPINKKTKTDHPQFSNCLSLFCTLS
jgi:hypothetical protein